MSVFSLFITKCLYVAGAELYEGAVDQCRGRLREAGGAVQQRDRQAPGEIKQGINMGTLQYSMAVQQQARQAPGEVKRGINMKTLQYSSTVQQQARQAPGKVKQGYIMRTIQYSSTVQ